MKRFLPAFLTLAASTMMAAPATNAFLGTNASGTYTAEDVAGHYCLDYYSLIIYQGFPKGWIYGARAELTVDESGLVTFNNFYKDGTVPFEGEFDAEKMTITVPNNTYLGKVKFGTDSFEGYLVLLEQTVNSMEIADEDIVFTVDPEKALVYWSQTDEMKLNNVGLFIANEDRTKYAEEFRDINFYYGNALSSWYFGESKYHSKALSRWEREENNVFKAYNFNAEGWYNVPVQWTFDEEKMTMTCKNQYYVYDKDFPSFTNWITEEGNLNMELTFEIQSDVEGYYSKFPLWIAANEQMYALLTFRDYEMIMYGEFFGPATQTPVITVSTEAEDAEETVVTIEAAEGATIYYTIDGRRPTRFSSVYTEPFTVDEPNTTVQAFAYEEGLIQSFLAEKVVLARDAVKTVKADQNIFVNGNNIVAPAGSMIYNAAGVRVAATDLANGLYIVTTPAGKTTKVMVK